MIPFRSFKKNGKAHPIEWAILIMLMNRYALVVFFTFFVRVLAVFLGLQQAMLTLPGKVTAWKL